MNPADAKLAEMLRRMRDLCDGITDKITVDSCLDKLEEIERTAREMHRLLLEKTSISSKGK